MSWEERQVIWRETGELGGETGVRGRQVSWRESLADPGVTHGPELEGTQLRAGRGGRAGG